MRFATLYVCDACGTVAAGDAAAPETSPPDECGACGASDWSKPRLAAGGSR